MLWLPAVNVAWFDVPEVIAPAFALSRQRYERLAGQGAPEQVAMAEKVWLCPECIVTLVGFKVRDTRMGSGGEGGAWTWIGTEAPFTTPFRDTLTNRLMLPERPPAVKFTEGPEYVSSTPSQLLRLQE